MLCIPAANPTPAPARRGRNLRQPLARLRGRASRIGPRLPPSGDLKLREAFVARFQDVLARSSSGSRSTLCRQHIGSGSPVAKCACGCQSRALRHRMGSCIGHHRPDAHMRNPVGSAPFRAEQGSTADQRGYAPGIQMASTSSAAACPSAWLPAVQNSPRGMALRMREEGLTAVVCQPHLPLDAHAPNAAWTCRLESSFAPKARHHRAFDLDRLFRQAQQDAM